MLELLILLLVAGSVILARMMALQERWTACRVAAERLRVARICLPLTVVPGFLLRPDVPWRDLGSPRLARAAALAERGEAEEVKRAVRDQGLPVTANVPNLRADAACLQVMVKDQHRYHRRNVRKLERAGADVADVHQRRVLAGGRDGRRTFFQTVALFPTCDRGRSSSCGRTAWSGDAAGDCASNRAERGGREETGGNWRAAGSAHRQGATGGGGVAGAARAGVRGRRRDGGRDRGMARAGAPRAGRFPVNETILVIKRPIAVPVMFAAEDGVCETLEGLVRYQAGDAILTGVSGEQWPVARATFAASYDPAPDGPAGAFVKRPIPAQARRITEPCQVEVGWQDDPLEGRPGDWLLQYADGNWGVVSDAIFRETYVPV